MIDDHWVTGFEVYLRSLVMSYFQLPLFQIFQPIQLEYIVPGYIMIMFWIILFCKKCDDILIRIVKVRIVK